MNLFNTADWDSNKIGDENAKKLFNISVKKHAFTKRGAKITNRKNTSEHSKIKKTKRTFSSVPKNNLQSKNFKNVNSNSKINRKPSVFRNENATKESNSSAVINTKQNNIQSTKKNNVNTNLSDERVRKKLMKQKKQSLKKKNKLMENSRHIILNDIQNNSKINRKSSILRNENVTNENNSSAVINRKQNNIHSIKKKNTNSSNERVREKQNKQRSKKKNKLIENNRYILLNDKINNNECKQKKKLKNDLNLLNNNEDNPAPVNTKKAKLIKLLSSVPIIVEKKEKKSISLKDRMIEKLKASRFRYINEQIYNSESRDAQKYFKKDPDAFYAYHEGYKQQISKWPLNPVDVIIKSVRKMPSDYVIADLGCGEAKLAKSVPHTVYSYDLVTTNEYVTACDMSRVPLENESVNVVVFCLSLMGTNIREYLFEANRILKNGGILKIAEVESRFDTVDVFIDGVKKFGFIYTWKDLSHNLFYFLDFKKISKCKSLNKLPTIGLHPCLYKKR